MEIKKYDFIDALRGWAVLGVIFAHTPFPPGNLGFMFSFIGARGVQLFYVLSAFTLCLSVSQRTGKEVGPYRNFLIRRFFRITPMFYVAAFFFLWLDGTGPSFWTPNGIKWWHILTVLTHTNGWMPETINAIVPGGWSVAIETIFYLFLPWLLFYVTGFFRAALLTVFLMIAGARLNVPVTDFWLTIYPGKVNLVGYFVELWLPAQVCVFGLGICLFYWFKSPLKPSTEMARKGLSILLLIFFVVGSLLLPHSKRYQFFPWIFSYGILFVFMTYALYLHPFKFFVNRRMRFLGKISFSVYLLHTLGIRLGTYLSPLTGLGDNTYSVDIFILAVAMVLTVALSSLTYYWIELPGIAFGKRLITRLEDQSNTTVMMASDSIS